MGNKAYSTDGVEEANLDDLETKFSAKDRRTLLEERIKKYQKELKALEAANDMHEADDYEDGDCEDDCEDDYEG